MMSPDGAYVYFNDRFDRLSDLWRVPASGGAETRVLEGVLRGNFFVLNQGIYYIDQTPGASRLQFFDFATRSVSTIATGLGDLSYGLTASFDGRTILYTRVDSTIDDLMLVENFR